MPKILRILNRFNLGGPTYNAVYLTRGLAPEFETRLVAGMREPGEESSEFILESNGLKPEYLSSMGREINLLNDWVAFRKIQKIIKTFKPDIVHTHAAKSGALGRLAAWTCGVKTIVHTFHGHVFHSYFGPLKTNLFLGTERFLASRSTAIVAISNRQKQELAEAYKICPPQKIHVVPLGFDLDRFRNQRTENRTAFRNLFGLQDSAIAIGIIGRFAPIKNHPFFLRVFSQVVKQTNHKLAGFVIGDGPNAGDLKFMAKNLGIKVYENGELFSESGLFFTSWIKHIEGPLSGLDLVALTSLNEGTPVSLIEAMASGKPVISTRVGGVEDIVKDGMSGYLTKKLDESDFVRKMIELIENNGLRRKMGIEGEKFAFQNHSHQTLVENTRNLYHSLLD